MVQLLAKLTSEAVSTGIVSIIPNKQKGLKNASYNFDTHRLFNRVLPFAGS